MVFGTGTLYTKRLLKHVPQWFWGFVMCCFFNKAYLRVPFDIIKQYKVILLYHCWNHVVFSFIVVKDAASHSTNYSLPRGWGGSFWTGKQFQAYALGDLHQNKFRIHVQRPQESKIIKLLKNYGPCGFWWPAVQQMGKSHLAGVCCGLTLDSRIFDVLVVTYLHLWHLKEIVPLKGQPTWKASPIVTQPKNVDSLACYVLTLGNELKVAVGSH